MDSSFECKRKSETVRAELQQGLHTLRSRTRQTRLVPCSLSWPGWQRPARAGRDLLFFFSDACAAHDAKASPSDAVREPPDPAFPHIRQLFLLENEPKS